jgi:hypothetical protein
MATRMQRLAAEMWNFAAQRPLEAPIPAPDINHNCHVSKMARNHQPRHFA